MPAFTEGGGKRAVVKKEDGLLPSKKAAQVKRSTGTKGFAIADAGGKPPRASTAKDGVKFENSHMDTAMSDGKDGGPAKGPSFIGGKKYGASAISQAIRRKQKIAQTVD